MKVLRLPLLFLAMSSLALQTLSGCGPRSESADSASTQTSRSNSSAATKSGWLTNYEQGRQEAKANNKLMLIDFTGSDWCGWCILLDREIFSKPQFKEYASKNLVLVEVDFPKTKYVPPGTKAENERLLIKYQIQGFPTIIVLNGDGQVVAELGYVKGGPDAFIAVLEKLRKG